jgi:hypothetical protein
MAMMRRRTLRNLWLEMDGRIENKRLVYSFPFGAVFVLKLVWILDFRCLLDISLEDIGSIVLTAHGPKPLSL